jgi:hypothetical protein
MPFRRSVTRAVPALVFVLALVMAGLAAAGCGAAGTTTTLVGPATTMLVMQTTTTAAPAPETTTTAAPETTTSATEVVNITVPTTEAAAPAELSADAIAYAAQLGGKSYMGKELYLIIGASTGTEAECQALLDAAVPSFGDMQDYFVIQRSDNFTGLQPGYFVLIEAHLNEPSADELQFAQRGFPDAYVKTATVNTSDPLPVYEDVLGIAEGE